MASDNNPDRVAKAFCDSPLNVTAYNWVQIQAAGYVYTYGEILLANHVVILPPPARIRNSLANLTPAVAHPEPLSACLIREAMYQSLHSEVKRYRLHSELCLPEFICVQY